MNLRIRRAARSDIPGMHRIRTSVAENRLSDPARVQPADYRAMLDEHGRGWVAELDGGMVGFAVADARSGGVWALFVESGHEGRGVGRRLHDTMLHWLFDSGTESVWLTTEPGTRAERFYRRAGWTPAGKAPNGEARYEMSRAEWLGR